MRSFALKPPNHQILFLALSKMLFACEWGAGDDILAYRQTLSACGSDQISLIMTVWTFPGYKLILLNLGGTTWRAFPKLLLVPWIADALGR